MSKINYLEFIENNTIRCEASQRGGGIEIDCSSIFGGDAKMTAYQNYLGGGMLGSVQSDNNFFNEMKPKDIPKFYPLETELKKYFWSLTNHVDDEWEETSFKTSQTRPASAY